MNNIKDEMMSAEMRIRAHIRETLLDYSVPLSRMSGANVYLKCENLQYTGSFKVRGAMSKLLSLSLEESKKGVIAASSGNHGAAVAYGLKKLKIPGIVFVPENASIAKIDNIKNYDVQLKFHSTDCMQTEIYAREYAKQHDMIYLSPYNDLQVISGQGTIALELVRQLHQMDVVFVPIGGGGLISGIAACLQSLSPKTKVIGCLPENSPVMAESIKVGKIVEMETKPTISDATAGGIEPGAITFDLCQKYVSDYITVTEDEIKAAIVAAIKTHHFLIEGAAGVALAALLKNKQHFQHKNAVVILSGANISLETLRSALI